MHARQPGEIQLFLEKYDSTNMHFIVRSQLLIMSDAVVSVLSQFSVSDIALNIPPDPRL